MMFDEEGIDDGNAFVEKLTWVNLGVSSKKIGVSGRGTDIRNVRRL